MGQHVFALPSCMTFALVLVTTCAMSTPGMLHAGEWIEGRVTHVRDVDTIEVHGLPVRLNGVDGKRWMQKQVLRKPVRCWLTGAKTHDRWVGTCHDSADRDIGALAIAAGMARDCPRYSGGRYTAFETAESRRLPRHGYCR